MRKLTLSLILGFCLTLGASAITFTTSCGNTYSVSEDRFENVDQILKFAEELEAADCG